jgi:glycine cleavage system H protein
MATKIPKAGEFAEGKLWFTRRGSEVTVGLTQSAIEELGELDSISLPSEGDEADTLDAIGNVDGTISSLELVAPARGSVIETNGVVETDPTIAQDDPAEEGWLFKMAIEDPAELKEYAVTEEADEDGSSED